MRSARIPPRVARSSAVALCSVGALLAGCDRDDQAKKAGPATQPATQAAPAAAPADGAGGAGAASPGAATPGAATPGVAASDPGTRPADPRAGRPGETFVVEENPEMKGRFGRLLVQFPEGSGARGGIRLYKAGEEESVQSVYDKLSADLLPGTYDVEVSNVRIHGVEVKPRHNSRTRVGALKISAESNTAIKVRGADGKQVFSGYGSNAIGLPVGKYTVEVSGQGEEVTIKDGEVAEF